MTTDRSSRKLVVILHADVMGSTALVQRDETVAHNRITDAFSDFSETISTYSGTVHEIRGDALVAEFARASDALSAAIGFQQSNAQHNEQFTDNIAPEIRVGISLGEVVIADDTLTGPGVVLAQRVEQLANPGGICITAAIHEATPRRLPFAYEKLGERDLRGFDEPVRVYAVCLKSGEVVPAPEPTLPAPSVEAQIEHPKRRWFAGAVVALVLIAGGVVVWWQPWKPEFEPASLERMKFPLPEKPSIAVLPFENLGGDPEQTYFADGITEDLITDLSKISGLFVIARNSTFTYKGKRPDIRRVAEALGVRYVLEGSVRRADDQVRINAQLVDATTGGHLWAQRYDGKLDDVFGLQDTVTRKIVAALAVQVTKEDEERVARKETNNAQAYDEFLAGWQHYLRQTPDNFVRAISHFEKAVELDPQYARAYAALAATYWQSAKRFWDTRLGLSIAHEARFLAEEFLAKAMQNPTPLAHQIASDTLLQARQHDEAIAEAEHAIALDSNDADSYIALAGALSLAGRPDEAIKFVERAMRLNPHYPPSYLYQLGVAQFGQEQFDQAAISFERATALNPDDRWSYRLLLATYGLLGRSADAASVLEMIEEKDARGGITYFDPLTIRTSAFWVPYKIPADAERFAEGLRKAGLPD